MTTHDLHALREGVARRPLRPYEVLLRPQRQPSDVTVRAKELMRVGWAAGRSGVVRLRPPVPWDEAVASDRSQHFALHSWHPLEPLLSAFDRTGEASYLRFALEVALDWIRRYPSVDGVSPFAWYDMAIGFRALRLGYLADAVARTPFGTDAVLEELVRAAGLHRDALADEGFFPSHSNHGLFFAAGQAALATRLPELPGMERAREQAAERLDRMVRSQFTAEGVHREHSPKYHWLILNSVAALRAAGFLAGEEQDRLFRRMQEALAWFVLPNGRLAMFGDTDHRLLVGADWPHADSDALRFVVSGGREGAPPAETLRAFPASGYVVCRSGWPRGPEDFADGSYLAQACAFHSRTHKHADDLTFLWYDRGHEILVDAGGYGYAGKTEPGSELWKDGFWYADPNRVYCESTKSHNTVQVDGRNLPRRRVEPYGSALVRWGERDGVYFTDSSVRHWGTVCHRRVLLFRPSEWLLVLDRILDEESEQHELLQRFLFAPELAVEADDSRRLAVTLPGERERLHVVSLTPGELLGPVKGQETPEKLGWISREDRELLPCWSSGFGVTGRTAHTFATLFAFGREAPRPRPDPGLEEPEGERFRAAWEQDGLVHAVAFLRNARTPFALDYRITFLREGGRAT